MGMDVYGRKPNAPEGEYFRRSISDWDPLAAYCQVIAPDITLNCEHWHSNDGDGLDERDSVALADVLMREIDNGTTARFIARHDETLRTSHCFFNVQDVQDFVRFLRACGGFAIC